MKNFLCNNKSTFAICFWVKVSILISSPAVAAFTLKWYTVFNDHKSQGRHKSHNNTKTVSLKSPPDTFIVTLCDTYIQLHKNETDEKKLPTLAIGDMS